MIRYWFDFDFENYEKKIPSGVYYGCGVTAYDYNHAITLIKDKIFKGQILPTILSCRENIDISTLDQNKIIPNMRSPLLIGVWFPLGYQ